MFPSAHARRYTYNHIRTHIYNTGKRDCACILSHCVFATSIFVDVGVLYLFGYRKHGFELCFRQIEQDDSSNIAQTSAFQPFDHLQRGEPKFGCQEQTDIMPEGKGEVEWLNERVVTLVARSAEMPECFFRTRMSGQGKHWDQGELQSRRNIYQTVM